MTDKVRKLGESTAFTLKYLEASNQPFLRLSAQFGWNILNPFRSKNESRAILNDYISILKKYDLEACKNELAEYMVRLGEVEITPDASQEEPDPFD